ncbi:hypothetical protein DCC79_01435 [bacterium]|nr:MAG: hypothetical protein DCC79_01435 [bacterium]
MGLAGDGVPEPGSPGAAACPTGSSQPADPDLVAAGWELRFLADAGRAAEARALYTSLGFEVRAEAVVAERLGAYCEGCQVAICLSHTLLYTRRPAPPRPEQPDQPDRETDHVQR